MEDWERAVLFLGLFVDELRESVAKGSQVKCLARLCQWPLWRAQAALECSMLRGMADNK